MNFPRLIPFQRSETHVVVDIGSSSVKLATVNNGAGRQTISANMIVPLPPGSVWNGWIRDKTAVAGAIRGYIQGRRLHSAAAVTAVPGRAIMIKTLDLPSMDIVDLETTIEFQAMDLIPANLNDVFLDFQVTRESKDKKRLSVLLTVAKKELVHGYMEVLSEAGLVPRIIDVDYFALENLCHRRQLNPNDETVCVMHIGASVTTLNITGNGAPRRSTDLRTGGQTFTDRIAHTLGISCEEAETLKVDNPLGSKPEGWTTLVPSLCEELAHELKRAVNVFATVNGNQRIDRLLVCGGGAKLAGVEARIFEEFHDCVESCAAWVGADESSADGSDELSPEFAVVRGLAMRAPWHP